jgi:hypothetical protein
MHFSQPLTAAALNDLRPTQMTVGAAEVAAKRAEWAQLKRKERARQLAAHWFPAMRGPGGHFYIVDHHHLGSALLAEKVEQVWIMQLADYADLKGDMFWRLMEFQHWAHPYDAAGRRRDYAAMPGELGELRDDPFRSLAGLARKSGAYAKDAAPYAEFLWAEFFRRQPALRKLGKGGKALAEIPAAAVEHALTLAHSPAARHLPGWSGAVAA